MAKQKRRGVGGREITAEYKLPELTAVAVVEGVDAPASVESPFAFGTGGAGSDGAALYLPVVPELC